MREQCLFMPYLILYSKAMSFDLFLIIYIRAMILSHTFDMITLLAGLLLYGHHASEWFNLLDANYSSQLSPYALLYLNVSVKSQHVSEKNLVNNCWRTLICLVYMQFYARAKCCFLARYLYNQ